MAGSVHVITRKTKGGDRRYSVRYRRGGRAFPQEWAGTFKRQADARSRAQLVSGWLAQGLDPQRELAALVPASAAVRRCVTEVGREWLASRLDLSERSKRVYTECLKAIDATPLGQKDPATLAPADVQRQVTAWADAGLAAKTIRGYVSVLRQLLDFAEVEPNPARHRNVKLPTVEDREVEPPSAADFLKILDHVPRRFRLPLVVIEQTGMRVEETLLLEWRDVDLDGSRFRVRAETRKGRRGRRRSRWVQVPEWLMDLLADDRPADDRAPDQRLFPDVSDHYLRKIMTGACKAAGIAHFHPHDLRHRRLSLWHGQGIPAAELARRAGHAKPSMSLDVYSHVMPSDEASPTALETRLRGSAVVAAEAA